MAKQLLLLLIAGLLSCRQNKDLQPDPTQYACGQVIAFRTRGITGAPILYAKEINEYYLKTSPDTSRFQEIAVFCDLPDAYKGPNKVINFDGNFSPVNFRDSSGRDGRLSRYFRPALVRHVAIDRIN